MHLDLLREEKKEVVCFKGVISFTNLDAKQNV